MKVRLWKVVLGILLLALLVGGGFALYRAGYAHGVMADVTFPDGSFEGIAPFHRMPYGMRGYSGHMGFFPLGRLFFGGLIFFLLVGAIFRFFGMRHYWAMHRMGYAGEDAPPWMRHHPYWGKVNPEGEDDGKADKSEE